MEEGWVYVLVNSSYPGWAKVGRTTRPPDRRAAELSGVTGVPTPFIVAFDRRFDDCQAAERAVHAELDRRGWRVAPNREFFRGSAAEIIRVVLDTGDQWSTAARVPLAQAAEALLDAGDRALHGSGDALQDASEAARCYRLAASRGSSLALERLGALYAQLYAIRGDAASRRRALTPLKEGARRGNAYCYCEMACVFAAEGHLGNFVKAWKLFFSGRMAAMSVHPGDDRERFILACCRYIGLCVDLRLQPGHASELRLVAGAILPTLLAELDRVRADPVQRRRVTGSLRWTYATLMAEPAVAVAPSRRGLFGWMTAPGSLAALAAPSCMDGVA